MGTFLKAFIPLFVAIDPLGLALVFLGMSRGASRERQRRVIWQAVLTAGGVTLLFLFLGVGIFAALGIGVRDFQVAGGLILLILAAKDLVLPEPSQEIMAEGLGVVPLGLPLIAGPATLTAVIALSQTLGIPTTFAALSVNLGIVSLTLIYAEKLRRVLGEAGLRAISKIIALLLAAISVNMIRKGIEG